MTGADTRLPHGYTNATGKAGGVVRKSYLGPDPLERAAVERAALAGLHGRFPVPALVPGAPDGSLWLEEVDGRHAQEVIASGRAGEVLRLCGETRRRLSEIDPATVPGLPGDGDGDGDVIVHGDFGPQNVLLSAGGGTVLAVIDWELCRLGAAVDDLAWTEWIVRTHHPEAVGDLGELFAGYGERPAWSVRHEAMSAACLRCRDFCERWDAPDAVAMWEGRIRATEAFTE
ncbi:phosphotransferase family protein [Saccharothrix deserti]|uniref:phosphotransferase family protein n=1 Tax=Saccharothrix deserti TaxID=2593674 RepID=UPI00192E3355|nr:phosphotransferase [Saccharothrix deserti]